MDARTNYLSFGKPNVGTFNGRDVGLFQSNAILNDMTLIGVGGGGGQARNINTTPLGGIGAGWRNAGTRIQPQITYTTPNFNGFSATIGAFDNKDVNGAGKTGRNVGYQGLAQYEFKNNTLWRQGLGGLCNQKFDLIRSNNATGFERRQDGHRQSGPDGGRLYRQGLGRHHSVQSAAAPTVWRKTVVRTAICCKPAFENLTILLGVSHGESRTKRTSAEGSGYANRVVGTHLALTTA